jgi:hypothetical protein
MKIERVPKNTAVFMLLLIVLILVFFYFGKTQERLIGEELTKDIINNTKYIKFITIENNINLKSTILDDKDEILKFYEWVSSLTYTGINSSKQELKPGTEYAIQVYDNSNSPLMIMAYSIKDKQLNIGSKVFNLNDEIHNELDSFIYE